MMFIMMFVVLGINLLSQVVMAGDNIASYYSLHNISKNNYYCSSLPSAEVSYGLCYQPTPYLHSENLRGGKDQYDIFTSPKQICHKDSGECSMPYLWNPGGSVDPYVMFRIFVPPGTTYFFVEIYMPRDAWIAAVARMGMPPESSVYQYPSYPDIPQPTTGRLINDYRDTDIITKNGGGHTTVIAASADSTTGFSGDWFYVKIWNYGGGEITNIKYGMNILTSRLRIWWDTMITTQDWADLENGIVKHTQKDTLDMLITILRIMSGLTPSDDAIKNIGDVNGDGKIGFEELIYVMQRIAQLRQ